MISAECPMKQMCVYSYQNGNGRYSAVFAGEKFLPDSRRAYSYALWAACWRPEHETGPMQALNTSYLLNSS